MSKDGVEGLRNAFSNSNPLLHYFQSRKDGRGTGCVRRSGSLFFDSNIEGPALMISTPVVGWPHHDYHVCSDHPQNYFHATADVR